MYIPGVLKEFACNLHFVVCFCMYAFLHFLCTLWDLLHSFNTPLNPSRQYCPAHGPPSLAIGASVSSLAGIPTSFCLFWMDVRSACRFPPGSLPSEVCLRRTPPPHDPPGLCTWKPPPPRHARSPARPQSLGDVWLLLAVPLNGGNSQERREAPSILGGLRVWGKVR